MFESRIRLDERHVVIVGGSSGMGAAAVELSQELGGRVTNVDFRIGSADVDYVTCDLRDRASIDEAVDALDVPIDVIMLCAGVGGESLGVERVNFIGQRHFLERLIDRSAFPRGAAIGFVSSLAGRDWETEPLVLEYLKTPDFEAAVQWIIEHPDKSTYKWSKMAVSAYVATRCYELLKLGIRINATQPGPTNTPLARANADTWLAHASDFRTEIGVDAATPIEQAWPLVFLCTEAASHIAGAIINVDSGLTTCRG